ncbi:hypothetical protein PVAG01_08556 [Phlyctema vagabunda]|uniref:Elongator complex protein 6 n=1 Tax=Phlyctema vagabunda TaxID=108571 RepID=A0ABR4P9Y1_9HELO
MTSRIPPLLEPYLSLPPEASLVLLTSVLGASTNWLVLRFLYSTLMNKEDAEGPDTNVVMISFMRDLNFWRDGAKRLGLDLDKFNAKKQFTFVDGLSGLFVPKQPKDCLAADSNRVLQNTELEAIQAQILDSMNTVNERATGAKTLLIVDQLDVMMALKSEKIHAVNLGELLMCLQERVHATVITAAADFPLILSQQTLLERNHAAFVIGLAHRAEYIMSLRLLDTGTARDVSGVLRITKGNHTTFEDPELQKEMEEKELLYFVGGDGGVKAFERGQ